MIFVTRGFASNVGYSTVVQTFPGRSELPNTTLMVPDALAAYARDASVQALMDAGSIAFQGGSFTPLFGSQKDRSSTRGPQR